MQSFALLTFVILFATSCFARPSFQTTATLQKAENENENNLRRYVEKEVVSRDFENGEKFLDYDVTLNENVVLIDEQHLVEEVICNGLEMTLVFVKGQSIPLSVGLILAGGEEWKCVHPQHNRVLPFNRKITKISDPVLDSVTLETEIVELTELFKSATVTYKSTVPEIQEPVVIPKGTIFGQAELQEEEEEDFETEVFEAPEEGDDEKRRASNDFAFGEIGDVFFENDVIVVPYTFSSKFNGKKFEICLRRKRLVLDKDVSCQTITFSSLGKGEVSFKVQTYYEASAAYYIKFDQKGLFGSSFSSSEIGINPATILTSPSHQDEFYKGMNIVAGWYANSAHKNKQVELALVKTGIFDKKVMTWQVTLSSESKTIAVDSLPKGADSGDYYFKITYSCFVGDLFCDLKDTSDEFRISRDLPGEKSVDIVVPKEGDIYKGTNNQINIQWVSNALSTSDTIKVSICRDTYGIDPCPLRKKETKNTGKLSVTVPSSWKGSSNYYVVIQYNCKLFFCGARESRRFAINYDPQFTFLSPTPKEGEQLEFPLTVQTKFTKRAGASIDDNKMVKVKLMRQVPFLDLVHNSATTEVSVKTGASGVSFPITEGSIFSVRFMIAYNCKLFNFFCEREYSPLFSIPVKYVSGWNYNPTTKKAKERKTIFNMECGDKCKGYDNYFCKACNKVPLLKSKIDVACENCFISTEVKLYDFGLNVNWLGVSAASLNVEGSATAWFDALVQFDAAYKIQSEFELAAYDLIGTKFNVGPIQVNLYARVALNTTLAFQIDGVAKVTAGFDATVSFNANASYGGIKGDSRDVKFGLTSFNKHTPTIDLRVNLYGEAGLKPMFDINAVDLLRFWIAIHPYIDLTAKFQVPAFRPGKNPDPNPFFVLGTGCDKDHYSEYDVRLHVEANMHASALKKWSWDSPVFNLLNKSLVCGCLFTSKGPLTTAKYTVTKTLAQLGYTEETFKIALLNQITTYAFPEISASRLDITFPPIDTTNKFAVGTFNVLVTAFQTDDAHENIDLAILTSVIKNQLSNFYQNDFGKQLKGILGPYA